MTSLLDRTEKVTCLVWLTCWLGGRPSSLSAKTECKVREEGLLRHLATVAQCIPWLRLSFKVLLVTGMSFVALACASRWAATFNERDYSGIIKRALVVFCKLYWKECNTYFAKHLQRRAASCLGDSLLDQVENVFIIQKANQVKRSKWCGRSQCKIAHDQRAKERNDKWIGPREWSQLVVPVEFPFEKELLRIENSIVW